MHDALLATAATLPPRPGDQADGLRRLFADTGVRFVPLVSNPNVAFGGVLIERLCAAFAERGKHTLVVDAGERSPAASDLALLDLAACVERLSDSVSYLAARGLSVRHVDARGSTRAFLSAAADAAPDAQVLLVHAPATELARMFDAGPADVPGSRPILLADDRPASVTHAYAAMKQLQRRTGRVVYDLLLGAAANSPRAERIAAQLAGCADQFLGAVLCEWARVDPASDVNDPIDAALRRLAREALRGGEPIPHHAAVTAATLP
jgi:flagellar biosynthesis protein FlhG